MFKLSRACYEKALEYFVMDGRVTDHVNINQKIGQMYRDLADFETGWKRKVGMGTRCQSLLSPLYEELNHDVFLLLSKELSFACGQAMQDIQAIHHERGFNQNTPSAERAAAMKKCDKAGFQAYSWFFKFLSLFNTKEGKHPETVMELCLKWVQLAPCWLRAGSF